MLTRRLKFSLSLFLLLPAAFRIAQASQSPEQSSSPVTSQSSTPAKTDSQAPGADFSEPRRLLQQGKYDEAIALLKTFETKNPELPGLSHELGAANYRKGDYLAATTYLKKAQSEDPKDSEATA